jgi:hypothetical protein
MTYLLDSNTFIEAKNLYYAFDFCPAYWEWIIHENGAGHIFSIDRILQELSLGKDELADWAKERGEDFFLPIDEKTNSSFAKVANYVQSLPCSSTNKSAFLRVADPVLIAHAAAHGYTVVTREVAVPSGSQKIKIPNVCQTFGVPFTTPFEMMRQLKASFQMTSVLTKEEKETHDRIVEARRGELAYYEDKLKEMQDEIDEKQNELEDVEHELKDAKEELEKKEMDLGALNDELKALQQDRVELEADFYPPD